MKITVITVVYNAKDEIVHTIEAVLNQTKPPYEYLLIDGASSDGTLEIIKSYEKQFIQKGILYKFISEKDYGIYDAMNKGVKLADGDFIVFSNAGDWLEINALATYMDVYGREKYDFAYGSIGYIGKRKLIKRSCIDKIVSSRNWNHPSSIVKKCLYQDNPFDLNYPVYADFDWFLKMRKKDIRIVMLPANIIISNFKIGGVSINSSFSSSLKRANEKYRAYIKNGYSKLYFIEAFGWEFIKCIYAKING